MSANLVLKKDNIFGDNIAEASLYNFSRGNLNDTNRILNITTVASICYQSPKAIGSESLYKRLLSESNGLPSSSFEFIPVLLTWQEVMDVCSLIETPIITKDNDGISISKIDTQTPEIEKYGQWIEELGCKYLLTNFRAITFDYEKYGDRGVDLRKRYNTEYECDIIDKYYKVFRFKVDFPTRSQMVRHRVNLQELSRRYVSGKRVEVKHYLSKKLKKVVSKYKYQEVYQEFIPDDNFKFGSDLIQSVPGMIVKEVEIDLTTQNVIDICMNHYYKALEDGVKPQEARRIIPQTGYTEFWMGFLPFQLENFFKLRDDSHAQWEVRQCAIAMKEMLNIPLTVDEVKDEE